LLGDIAIFIGNILLYPLFDMGNTTDKSTLWFSKSIERTLEELKVNAATGLTDQEAETRMTQYGLNKLQGKKKKSILQMGVAQLKDALIYVLFGAVIITFFMGEYIDGIIILLVIIINAVLGVVQEIKAGNAIEALRNLSTPKALVKRNGATKEIESEKIVPGDILILDAGRLVAADLRLIESANLKIDESALTGESVAPEKDADATLENPETPLGDRINSAFMSTLVTYGRGVGIVVSTGMNTEVGKIADIIDEEGENETPLEKRLDELGKTLGKLAAGVCVVIFIIAWLQGRDLVNMFLTSVSLAVASIPEGLAAIVAVVLSIGVTKMARRKAIIRKLPAVETLGSVNIVCSDKTGTLTQNKMTVTRYFNLDEGEVSVSDVKGHPREEAILLARAMILSSDATYENGKGTGDPTEIALLIFGDGLGIDRKSLAQKNVRMEEMVFDSDRKLMSTLEEQDGRLRVFVKGAIDNLIPRCTHVRVHGNNLLITEEHIQQFKQATDSMSGQALRTLAAAYKPVESIIESSEMERNLILLGVVGMIDPPRMEVKDSIQKAKQAGITVIMITGDHKNTAFAIAKDLEIAESPEQVATGEELNKLSDAGLIQNIHRFKVFARVSPEHKVKIVRAFKARGNIVSMTGDGVNDAPSLNTADIGVAMGITGTDVAKNASDMILADDNFSTIISAIEQGRNIYNNIKKSVIFLLASNLGEVIAMVVAILIGMPAPLIATQLLWINLLTDTLPAIALGMDPGDPDIMQQTPRNPKESFFAKGAGMRVILGGSLIGLLTIFAFWFGYYQHGYSPYDANIPENVHEYARTMAFMSIVSCQLFYALTFRHPLKSIFKVNIFSNKYLIGAVVIGLLLQLIALGIPVMKNAFKLEMLSARGWMSVIVIGFLPIVFNEIAKAIMRQREPKPHNA
jgi:Ca2+-transporting ATPase